MAARFGFSEDTVRLAAALRPALACRGVPEQVYVDNGSAFVDSWLLRACASLGIRLVHSAPGRPEGRGKIERFFRTVRDQFLVEITDEAAVRISGLDELNRLFTAWAETVYHVGYFFSFGAAESPDSVGVDRIVHPPHGADGDDRPDRERRRALVGDRAVGRADARDDLRDGAARRPNPRRARCSGSAAA